MIKKFFKVSILLLAFFLMYSLTLLFKNNNIGSNNFIVTVDSTFLNKTMVEVLLEGDINSDSLIDNFNDLENKISSNPHVKNIKVFKDLIGNINVEVEQFQPIARIVSGINAKNYIDSEGNLFPISSNHSERVMLIHTTSDIDISDKDLKFTKDFLQMINFIKSDDFLSKIISEIEIKTIKNIVIHPQLSKQKFIFGYPDGLDDKFEKILLFYKKIAPTKGWNTYKTVNVKFRNQIICDKNA